LERKEMHAKFVLANLKDKNDLEHLGIDVSVVLKLSLNK
jgi:hypothetical protein